MTKEEVTLDWCGRGGAAPGSQSPLMEEQEGPVWCLNGPRAGLGEISWMGAYLPEVNSAVGFGSMLMRPRLYKGQLVSFCSLYYKPPPISAQTSCKCRKEGGGAEISISPWVHSSSSEHQSSGISAFRTGLH